MSMSANDVQIIVEGVGLAHSVSPVQDSLWWNVKAFVRKTHYMIETLTKEGGHVASWIEDGKLFVIKNKSELVSRFKDFGFKMEEYASFEKQLNNYSFRRVASNCVEQANSFDSDAVFFIHDKFQRNNPAEMVTIVDRRNKESPKRKTSEAETLVNKFARLESRVEELKSENDLLSNKFLEQSAHLESRVEELKSENDLLSNMLRKLYDFLQPQFNTRNASNERVYPNMDDDCPNQGTNTVNDRRSSEDWLVELLRGLVDSEHTGSCHNKH